MDELLRVLEDEIELKREEIILHEMKMKEIKVTRDVRDLLDKRRFREIILEDIEMDRVRERMVLEMDELSRVYIKYYKRMEEGKERVYVYAD